MKPRAFIVHGRDTDALKELVTFLDVLGVGYLSFDDVSADRPNQFIADIVVNGISAADVVIALFTPDEQAALYDPRTAAYLGGRHGEARWQARPNVLFEAGVALGIARDRTILATLGADVKLFSDVLGIHVIDLAKPTAKSLIHSKLSNFFPEAKLNLSAAAGPEAGDFSQVLRARWPHYDELEGLERQLAECRLGRAGVALRDILVTLLTDSAFGQSADRAAPEQLVRNIKSHFSDSIADKAYWWLIVYGVFRFAGIEKWFTGDHWTDSIDNVVITERGRALLEKLQVRLPRPNSA